jgi:signal transduction histidine kinase
VRVIGSSARWPRRTIRLRLTLLYGLLFLVAGAALLAITYGLVAGGSVPETPGSVFVTRGLSAGKLPTVPQADEAIVSGKIPSSVGPPSKGAAVIVQQKTPSGPVVQLQAYAGQVRDTFRRLTAAQAKQLQDVQTKATNRINQVKSAQLSTLLTRSGIALAIMALASIGLGWVMAGRALRPVRTMSSRARGISARNLHERLALEGPDDELKELADTFDGLLTRLEGAFESQRRFVANASHELRTPITLERALVEVALADPNPTIDSMRDTCRRVLAASEQQERLIEALLTLARSQRGLERRGPVDLREVTTEIVRAVPTDGLSVETQLDDAGITGDEAMLERLVANLIENAVRYNQPGGWVKARTGLRAGRPTLEVENPGPVIDADQVESLVKPFVRAVENDRAAGRANGSKPEVNHGLGLGLSIVQAIAEAHDAELTTVARPDGGLRVAVAFPPAGPAPQS